uniref:Uncharacterized protein n=1 Tax=Polytomella parva TaxID=51329 RepID=A0A7S0YIP5_9CHLO|mmetsp:Transcript_22912/g.40488  ORF Transcript_22912/g.40488 Transcript_22912/m.40488 type:complete len:247 (+) Transcript_22912:37-777(+)
MLSTNFQSSCRAKNQKRVVCFQNFIGRNLNITRAHNVNRNILSTHFKLSRYVPAYDPARKPLYPPNEYHVQQKKEPEGPAASRNVADLVYLSELLAIQQSDGPKNLGFFGTRNMGATHQKLVEMLSYAYALTGNHIYTSGATGTNAAVIKGALRAGPDAKLTVILPQSLYRQSAESRELLQQVKDIEEMPQNNALTLFEASRSCNEKIISKIHQVVCFAFHDSRLLLETCAAAREMHKIVTLFYLD